MKNEEIEKFKKDLQVFVETLNKGMDSFDKNIERHMARSEKMEWEALKKPLRTIPRTSLRSKKIVNQNNEEKGEEKE